MVTTFSNKRSARAAGLIYLGVVITGIISLMYIPSKLLVPGTPAATVEHIGASHTLLRYWIVSGLVCYTLFLFLPLALYQLLSPVNKNYARLMVLLGVMSVPVYFINVQNLLSVLSLVNGAGNRYGLPAEQMQAQVMLYLDQYNNGMRIVHIFSGLWLFPFGWLVYRCGFLHKMLGVLLMAGCFGYLINFVGNILVPGYPAMGISSYISLPASMGEIGTCLWLLVVGIRKKATG